MNKRQKELLQVQLDSEKKTISELKSIYKKALSDCEIRIRKLSMRTDMENLQSIIYQKHYQETIKAQIEGVLEQLHSNEYATVSDYLHRCYQDGYIGVMYDIAGQGMPLILPINQEQIAKAIQTDTKLSSSLYKSLGEDIKVLKNAIRSEISRGIANGSTWNEIAASMTLSFQNTPFNKAYNRAITITRTESHRIQCAAQLNAQKEAKKIGCDIVKQWDATLDGATRDTHRELDGKLADVDDDFKYSGGSVSAPGHFGDPSEDCNCRCILLQRAKWALDEAELETLKERAEYYGLDKAEDFEDFKKKYLKADESEHVRESAQKIKPEFIPATTIQEAEEYAKRFVVQKTWSGDGNVSFKGLSVESANKINEALSTVFGEKDIPLLCNIQPMNFRSNLWKDCEAPMAYRALYTGELYFNPRIMKNLKTVEAYIEEGKKAFDICRENVDRFSGSKKALIERYITAGRSLVAEDCQDIIKAFTEHEMGHHIQNQVILTNKEMTAVVKNGFDEFSTKLSGYATKDIGEYIAESYAAFMNGQEDLVDPELIKIFEGLDK